MGDEVRLFDRGDPHGDRTATGEADNSPAEHADLPVPVEREKRISLTLAFDTEEQREELLALLGLSAKRTGNPWRTWWPPGAENDHPSLFDLDDAA
jgi:hypothetical protein